MKCPVCSAPADVQETRKSPNGGKRRRYQCFNDHRFTTLENVAWLKSKQQKVSAPLTGVDSLAFLQQAKAQQQTISTE